MKYDELSDKAKEKARQWYAEGQTDVNWWWEGVYEQAVEVAKILGITFENSLQRQPDIQFSGFWSQGDGASWTGRYSASKDGVKTLLTIRAYAPQDTELHRIADELEALQEANERKIEAVIIRNSSHYSHSHTMEVNVYDAVTGDYWVVDDGVDDGVTELMRDFADWIYVQLEKEHDYLTSDEVVEEGIRANEYEFDEDGCIA